MVAVRRNQATLTPLLLYGIASLVVPGKAEGAVLPPSSALQDTILRIGVVHGDARQVFGSIRHVEVDDDGNVLILDDQSYGVSWFSPEGQYRDIGGRDGEGPGEFRLPRGLAIGPAGRVYVLDAAAKVAVFVLGEEGLALAREIRTSIWGSDICIEGDNMVVLGRQMLSADAGDPPGIPKAILHVKTLAGDSIRSFGAPLPVRLTADLEEYRYSLSARSNTGFVHCTGLGTVIVGSRSLGVIRSFSVDGELIWQTELNGFSPLQWETVDRGPRHKGFRAVVNPETGILSRVEAIGRMGDGRVAVTMLQSNSLWINDWSHFVVVALDPNSGVELGRRVFEMIVAARVENRLYGFVNDPFPRVMVLRHKGFP